MIMRGAGREGNMYLGSNAVCSFSASASVGLRADCSRFMSLIGALMGPTRPVSVRKAPALSIAVLSCFLETLGLPSLALR